MDRGIVFADCSKHRSTELSCNVYSRERAMCSTVVSRSLFNQSGSTCHWRHSWLPGRNPAEAWGKPICCCLHGQVLAMISHALWAEPICWRLYSRIPFKRHELSLSATHPDSLHPELIMQHKTSPVVHCNKSRTRWDKTVSSRSTQPSLDSSSMEASSDKDITREWSVCAMVKQEITQNCHGSRITTRIHSILHQNWVRYRRNILRSQRNLLRALCLESEIRKVMEFF